jgi:hypothetical protein
LSKVKITNIAFGTLEPASQKKLLMKMIIENNKYNKSV